MYEQLPSNNRSYYFRLDKSRERIKYFEDEKDKILTLLPNVRCLFENYRDSMVVVGHLSS